MKIWPYKRGGLIRKVTFLEGNLVVFSHVSVSKIWPGKGSDLSQRETIQ